MLNFYKPEKLPSLMVAPNGARPMKKDHPKVPVTIPEIVETGKACFENGATAMHFHIEMKKEYMFWTQDCVKKLYTNFKKLSLKCIFK